MEITIEKLDHMGSGIGYIDGKCIFVPKAIPGDIVDIKILKEKKNYATGEVIKYIKRSSDFVSYDCPFYEKCGGCHLGGLSYEQTLSYKKDRIQNILSRAGINNDVFMVPNDSPFNYRNKIELKMVNDHLGFYEARSHDVIELDTCKITKEAINKFIPELNNMGLHNADITVRCNFNDEILIAIKTKDDVTIKDDYSLYKVAGIVLNGDTVYGDNKFLEKVNDLFFEVSYDAFFQVNTFINEKLFNIIKENASGDTVLDLYSGVGTLSLMASRSAKKVYAIEIVPNAVMNAIKNAKINNINNVHFILGDASEKIKMIEDNIDTIIVDPPRSGLDEFTINKIKELKPNKLIYISCETQKLSEDLKSLQDTFNVNKIYGLDMFSYTYHVETVCILERINV